MGETQMAPPISEEAKGIADGLINTYTNLCLVSGSFQDKPCAFVCAANQDEKTEEIFFAPLFMVVTEDLHHFCKGPEGDNLNPFVNQKELEFEGVSHERSRSGNGR